MKRAIDVQARGLQPLSQAKPSFFGQTLNFSGRSQQPKMNKVFIKRQTTEFIPSSKMKCPKLGFLTIIGQSIFAG